MKKIVYYKTSDCGYQISYSCISEGNFVLNFLLDEFNSKYDWISLDIKGDSYIIWNDFVEEECDSWEDVPKLEISIKNYKYVAQQWNDNVDNLAPYLVLTQDDKGWVNLEAKQELSIQDLEFIKEENLRYQKHKEEKEKKK